MMQILTFLQDYGGVLIGLGFLAVVVYLLPARVRWYVASAGLAVLAFRTWQIYSSKKKFAEWDKQHRELTDAFDELKAERDRLASELEPLREKQKELEQRQAELQTRRDQLTDQGDTLNQEGEALSAKLAEAKQQAQQTDARIAKLSDAQAAIDKADRLVNSHVNVNPNMSDEDLMKLAQGIK